MESSRSSVALTSRPQWQALQAHAETIVPLHLRELFARDPARGERLHATAAGLYFDYAKQRVTDETLLLLLELAAACGLRERTEAMFCGELVNVTEQRAVLHTALRATTNEHILVNGRDVVADVDRKSVV